MLAIDEAVVLLGEAGSRSPSRLAKGTSHREEGRSRSALAAQSALTASTLPSGGGFEEEGIPPVGASKKGTMT